MFLDQFASSVTLAWTGEAGTTSTSVVESNEPTNTLTPISFASASEETGAVVTSLVTIVVDGETDVYDVIETWTSVGAALAAVVGVVDVASVDDCVVNNDDVINGRFTSLSDSVLSQGSRSSNELLDTPTLIIIINL